MFLYDFPLAGVQALVSPCHLETRQFQVGRESFGVCLHIPVEYQIYFLIQIAFPILNP